jgi:hypothetical protein
LCSVISEILKVVNNRLSVGEILCDLDKVFGYVNRIILVDVSECCVIGGKFTTFIPSCLIGSNKLFIDKTNAYDTVSSER